VYPWELFAHCPRCGGALPRRSSHADPLRCESCGFVYYFNAATAVAALIRNEAREILFIRREREPAMGKLALVGGFVDVGESAEAALRREVLEEVNLELGPLEFVSSHPNLYAYRDVTYATVDLFFAADAIHPARVTALDGVAGYQWQAADRVALDEVAFDSMRDAIRRYRTL
jgi:ADP-ribose pyrophosphatase YjhB (NUDIX family)